MDSFRKALLARTLHQLARKIGLVLCCVLAVACDRDSAPAGSGGTPVAADTDETPELTGTAETAPLTWPVQVYWGDLHLHSNYSFDSYAFGNKLLSPADAFRFARGDAVMGHHGVEAKLSRPLDFLLVSDHAEYLGMLVGIDDEDATLLGSSLGMRWAEYVANEDIPSIIEEYMASIASKEPLQEYMPNAFQRSVWHELTETAERYNDPGRFTAFIGYEWTSMVDGRNLHRNVIFRDGADKARQILPFSALDDHDPEGLWKFLDDYEASTGGEAIAIPHNGNLSNGLMFAEERLYDGPIDRAYAQARSRWEPIYEMTQVKGDAESHPLLSPGDDFADFENWDKDDIAMNPKPAEQLSSMLEHEYARSALKLGLRLEADLGMNPFKFGLIGSTDSHTTFSTADDDNFFGKFPDSEPGADRLQNKMGGVLWNNRQLTASGYAGIWATENTRVALFEALKRREVYATTGPRVVVRLFGGWDFTAEDAARADFAEIGYRRGVPMGGDLAVAPAGESPRFMISAAKDPRGANLDRIQIVKGWLAADGSLAEKVYDVAASGTRMSDAESDAPEPVGSTVDIATATYENSIGAQTLQTLWTDPDFDPMQRAFYYARAIEIPTPRWTTYEAVRYSQDLPEDVPASIQERAYTSPIWYTPASTSE